MEKHEDRNEKTGRYTSKGIRVCTCGRFRGTHDAGAPYPFGDLCMDARDDADFDCDAFKAVRKPSPEQVAEAWRRVPAWLRDAEFAAEVRAAYPAATI